MLYLSAILLGIFSSLHCVGMCGPIALATPVIRKNFFTEIFSRILYNMGRTTAYVALGSIAGIAGEAILNGGWQRGISIASGVLILVWVIVPSLNPENSSRLNKFELVKILRRKTGDLLRKKTYGSIFSVGLLNGLLPCGMVYMALVAAIAAGGVQQASTYMFFFGLGTWPLMLIFTSLWEIITPRFKKQSRKFIPYLVGMVGVLLIVRGLGLGIPYLSPGVQQTSHSITHCSSN